jgi:hypothetical protein
MTQVLKAYQIPAYKGENEIRWSVENIDIVYDRKTEKWSYYLLEYDEEKQDWTDKQVVSCSFTQEIL